MLSQRTQRAQREPRANTASACVERRRVIRAQHAQRTERANALGGAASSERARVLASRSADNENLKIESKAAVVRRT